MRFLVPLLLISLSLPAPASEAQEAPQEATAQEAPQKLEVVSSAQAPTIARDSYTALPNLEIVGSDSLNDLSSTFTTEEEVALEVKMKLVEEALKHQGVPYVFGGAIPSGWDCSGYVKWVTHVVTDLNLPHGVGQIARSPQTYELTREEAVPGDFVVYSQPGKANYHMGIYLGNDEMVHAPMPGKDTMVSPVRYSENTVQFFSLKLY